MRVLLRNQETGHFYAGPGIWTEKDSEAWDFQKTDSALDAVWEAKLPAVEVLVRFDNPVFEIPLNVVGLGRE